MSLFHDVTNKPWDQVGLPDGIDPKPVFRASSASVALTIFLGVVSVVFSLLLVSYYIRMQLGEWVPVALPDLLWSNTGVLVLSRGFMQLAVTRIRHEEQTQFAKGVCLLFLLGDLLAASLIAGQYLAWTELVAAGQGVRANPSNAFFYLLTGVHALHLIGGLWVWSRAEIRISQGVPANDIHLSIKLCTVYWHFLLLIWVGLFVLLSYT